MREEQSIDILSRLKCILEPIENKKKRLNISNSVKYIKVYL